MVSSLLPMLELQTRMHDLEGQQLVHRQEPGAVVRLLGNKDYPSSCERQTTSTWQTTAKPACFMEVKGSHQLPLLHPVFVLIECRPYCGETLVITNVPMAKRLVKPALKAHTQ